MKFKENGVWQQSRQTLHLHEQMFVGWSQKTKNLNQNVFSSPAWVSEEARPREGGWWVEGSEILSSSLCKQRIKSSRSRPGGEFKSSTSPPEQRRAARTRTCAGRVKGKATLAPSARMTTDPWRPAPRWVRNLPRPFGVGAGGPRGDFSRSCSNNQTKKGGGDLGH